MNIVVILIEIAIMLASFTVLVSEILLINLLTFINDYPPKIQAEYYRSQCKERPKKEITQTDACKKVACHGSILVSICLDVTFS